MFSVFCEYDSLVDWLFKAILTGHKVGYTRIFPTLRLHQVGNDPFALIWSKNICY